MVGWRDATSTSKSPSSSARPESAERWRLGGRDFSNVDMFLGEHMVQRCARLCACHGRVMNNKNNNPMGACSHGTTTARVV